MWCIGCILAELIYCSDPYAKEKGFDTENRFAFQGDSCYPLSPKGKAFSTDD